MVPTELNGCLRSKEWKESRPDEQVRPFSLGGHSLLVQMQGTDPSVCVCASCMLPGRLETNSSVLLGCLSQLGLRCLIKKDRRLGWRYN
jgi:hypothetical protein